MIKTNEKKNWYKLKYPFKSRKLAQVSQRSSSSSSCPVYYIRTTCIIVAAIQQRQLLQTRGREASLTVDPIERYSDDSLRLSRLKFSRRFSAFLSILFFAQSLFHKIQRFPLREISLPIFAYNIRALCFRVIALTYQACTRTRYLSNVAVSINIWSKEGIKRASVLFLYQFFLIFEK